MPAGRLSVMAQPPAYARPRPRSRRWTPRRSPWRSESCSSRAGASRGGRCTATAGRSRAGASAPHCLEPGAEGIWQEPSPVRPDGSFVIDHVARGANAHRAPGALGSRRPRRRRDARGDPARGRDGHRRLLPARRPGGGERHPRRPARARRSRQPEEPGGRRHDLVRGLRRPRARGRSRSALPGRDDAGGRPLRAARLHPRPRPGQPRDVAGNQRYPGREVEVPDVDRFELDLEIAATTVSGMVVDQDERRPGARTRASGCGARAPGPGRTGASRSRSSRGSTSLEAQAPGRRRTVLPLSVGPEGLSDLRVEMERGVEIRGRVLDAAGRPFRARDPGGRRRRRLRRSAYTLADGSFRIDGLGAQPYALVTGGDLPGWAVRGGVTPGDEPVTLALRPGGRIAVRGGGRRRSAGEGRLSGGAESRRPGGRDAAADRVRRTRAVSSSSARRRASGGRGAAPEGRPAGAP